MNNNFKPKWLSAAKHEKRYQRQKRKDDRFNLRQLNKLAKKDGHEPLSVESLLDIEWDAITRKYVLIGSTKNRKKKKL